jgi:uncharacterized membrane-anchored protein
MMEHALIGTLVFVLIVVILVWAAIYIVDRTLPTDVHLPVKIIIGAIGLIAVLYRLLPLAGI